MGTIVALGPAVDEFEIGDRVTVEIHSGCGQCKRCRMVSKFKDVVVEGGDGVGMISAG